MKFLIPILLTSQTLAASSQCSAAERDIWITDMSPGFGKMYQFWTGSGKEFLQQWPLDSILLDQFPQISTPCLICYSKLYRCGQDECSSSCASEMQDPGCMNCLGTNCIQALASCVGASSYEELPVFPGGKVLRAYLPSQTTTTNTSATVDPTSVTVETVGTTEDPTVEIVEKPEGHKTPKPISLIGRPDRSSPSFAGSVYIQLAQILLFAIPLAI